MREGPQRQLPTQLMRIGTAKFIKNHHARVREALDPNDDMTEG